MKVLPKKTYTFKPIKKLLKQHSNLYLSEITFLNLNENTHYLNITDENTISKEIYIHRDNEVDSIVQTSFNINNNHKKNLCIL